VSGAGEIRRETGEDIEARAAEWLVARRVRDDWNADRQAELDAWLEESPLRRVAYLRLEGAWGRTLRLRALHQPERAAPAEKRPSALLKSILGAVAMIILATGAAVYALQPRAQTYATALGEHRTVALDDGTRIDLNTDTVLRVLAEGAQRTAWLDRGEAFFQVKHSAARPFLVVAGTKRITDLGTEFLVRRNRDHLEVDVVKGRIKFEVDDEYAHKPALLTSGDTVVADGNSLFMPKKSAEVLTRELGWRRGVLIFDATPLADAASEFNRYNDSKIIIADDETARLSLGGTFRTNDGEAFVRVAQEVLGLHIRRFGNETVISR
jgi:transmembrane sensor